LTFIGERGLSLSGGQRARVSLARAVYHDFDIYLLDDPLSAVDAKVGRHIFEECITGILSNRIRLLVTHHLHYLKNVNEIIVLDNAQIYKRGSFDEIASTSDLFTKILDESHDDNAERENTRLECKQSEDKKIGVQFGMDDEDRNVGMVSLKTYWKYFRSYSSLCGCLMIFLLSLIPEGKNCLSVRRS
jgi:ATP-binding cassette subfamily C (CFTR/MRP) protein 4